MENNSSSANGYKTLSIVLIVLLVVFIIGGLVYWNELNNTQKEQQAQIDSLNQQIAEDKESLSSEVQSARDQATQALEAKNAELQQKLDTATTPDDSGNDSADDSTQ